MRGIVDRFEGDFVVIEIDGKTQDIRRKNVNLKVKAGDVVVFFDGEWQIDEEETKLRTTNIKKLMDDVWEDD